MANAGFGTRRPRSALIHHRAVHKEPRGKGKVTVQGEDQISVDNSAALVAFARAGAGVAAILEFAVQADIDAGRLVKLLPDWEMSKPGLYAVWPPNVSRHGLARKLLDHLQQELPPA